MVQTGIDSVLRRYSQGILRERYSVNEVLLVAELIKMSVSVYMIHRSHSTDNKNSSAPYNNKSTTKGVPTTQLPIQLYQLLLQSRPMLLLVLLYGSINILSYYALARISAATFVVITNLKTLTTAAFSSLLLGRSYSWTRWRALILLVCGVVLFVLPTLQNVEEETAAEDAAVLEEEKMQSADVTTLSMADAAASQQSMARDMLSATTGWQGMMLGFLAEVIVITISGFCSIYFEMAIKNVHHNNHNSEFKIDIWGRNWQLGFYSVWMYMFLIWTQRRESSYSRSGENDNEETDSNVWFFRNWTPCAVILAFGNAAGGLLVALSIKYGDSILKTLAVSGSIIFASIVDHFVLGGPLTGQMTMAAVIVIISIINYTFDDSAPSTPAMTTTAVVKAKKSEDTDDRCGDDDDTSSRWIDDDEAERTLGDDVEDGSAVRAKKRRGKEVSHRSNIV